MTYRGWLLAFAIVATIGRPVEVRCDEALAKIKNIVVIYAENRSFDHLYGFFPGANGIDNATDEQRTQLDHDGKPLPHLVIFGGDGRPDPRFPTLPNAPFRIDAPPVNGRADAILLNPIPYQLWFVRDLIMLVICSPLIWYLTKSTKGLWLVVLAILWSTAPKTFEFFSNEALLFFTIGCALTHDKTQLLNQRLSKYLSYCLLAL